MTINQLYDKLKSDIDSLEANKATKQDLTDMETNIREDMTTMEANMATKQDLATMENNMVAMENRLVEKIDVVDAKVEVFVIFNLMYLACKIC